MEAVNQGAPSVGLKSKEYSLLLTHNRLISKFSEPQRKILQVDDSIAVAISGLTSDGYVLGSYLTNECIKYKFTNDEAIPIPRLCSRLQLKMQPCTQLYGERPFGVGLLIIGADSKKTHLFHSCPSANIYECNAMAIGSRSQSARTHLINNMKKFENSSLNELIQHGLYALRETYRGEDKLEYSNCSVVVIGLNTPFYELDKETIKSFIDKLTPKKPIDESSDEENPEPETENVQPTPVVSNVPDDELNDDMVD
ncbi:hypothetical protein A3Q56_00353 [Intoshia linei]|uniref:Proteasome subunit alpha type-1 n=1 Tax=Intoshia linei TaxID=1819745 RepID=A0A177BCD8_9BILA|nr:hypothetical protein A3Q56_00353 [Intoshia linei]